MFDALTLRRVDLFWENLWVIAHVVAVGTCIVLIHAIEREEGAETNPSKLHFWLTNIQQFFYGGIWSTFLVFYFRSSDIAASWPFLLILALSFWANESFKRHFVRLGFQVSLFYLAIFSFAIYIVPVLFHRIDRTMFLLAGLFSLAFIVLFLLLLWAVSRNNFNKSRRLVIILVAGVFALVNILYFTNTIPPLPLAIKEKGIYALVKRNSSGNYDLQQLAEGNNHWYTAYPLYNIEKNQPVFVYSAIFSPPDFSMKVQHQWQWYDADTKKWVTKSVIDLNVVGGREGGFRTFSEKFSVVSGKWRVNMLAPSGQVIGRVRFFIEIK